MTTSIPINYSDEELKQVGADVVTALREELRGVRNGRDWLVRLVEEEQEEEAELRQQITQAHILLNELGIPAQAEGGTPLTVAHRISLLATTRRIEGGRPE